MMHEQANHTLLGNTFSSSFVDTNKHWSIAYGTGSVSGHIVNDDVRVAGLKLKSLKFGVASHETSEFST